MKNIGFVLSILFLNLYLGFSQTNSEINSLLIELSETENSKEIIETIPAKKIKAFGEESLIILAHFFNVSDLTKVRSACNNRNLTKGEIAIIMADRIESMPYFTISQIQNCTMTFCENNPNRIEYYFSKYNSQNKESFKERYIKWLFSEDRVKNVKGKARKKRKALLSLWKKTNG